MKKQLLFAFFALFFAPFFLVNAQNSPCGQVYTDSGGTSGNYPDNANEVVSYCTNPGEIFIVNFSQLELADNDVINIYMSPSPTGNPMMTLTSSSQPTALTFEQCVTFEFISTNSGNAAGWLATLECIQLPCLPPFINPVPDNTTGSGTITWVNPNSAIVFLYEVAIVPAGTFPDASTPVQTVLEPSYSFSGLAPGDYAVFVQSNCNGNAFSDWSQPETFSVTNPIPCGLPTNIAVSNITNNAAVVNWVPTGSNSVQWQVIALPQSSGTPTSGTNGTMVTAIPFTITGLTGSTAYNFFISAICDGVPTVWSAGYPFQTLQDPLASPACGQNFYDNGGANANYTNNADNTYTICPQNPGDIVTVTFSTFDVEATWDALYVFNGNSIASPQISSTNGAGSVPGGLAGGFWGTVIPGPFTSTSPDGCLTFRFRSDNVVTKAGWTATVQCSATPPCLPPFGLGVTGITSNTALFAWVSGASATAWEVLAVPCGAPAPTASSVGITTSSSPYTFTGLNAATCYSFYVRSLCGSTEMSAWAGPMTITTAAAPPVCGGNFVDNGGISANYLNNSNSTVTICPTNPGDVVTVTFTSFDTEVNWDALYVYNGNSSAAPQISSGNPANNVPGGIPGGFWGTTLPGPFTSSNPDGCLTFVFRSDGSVTKAGWLANVTCEPAPTCLATSSPVVSNITASTATVAWVANNSETSWEVLALPCGTSPTASSAGIVTSNNPFTIENLLSSTCYSIYVRALCSATDVSAWSGPTNITTQIAPPACGGLFTDNGGPNANYANSSDNTYTICPTNPGDLVTVTFTSFDTETNWDALYVFDGPSLSSPQIASNNAAANVPGGLPGGFWGTTLPGPFTSSSPDGCLTFRFRSDTSVSRAGWVANVTCTPDADKILLSAFVDSNTNGTYDAGEPAFGHGNFIVQQNNSGTNTTVFSPTGRYAIYDTNPANTYDASYEILPEYQPYYSGTTFSVNDVNIPVGSGTQIFYFPVTLSQPFNDVSVSIVPITPPRPGMGYTNKIIYTNLGVASTDGTLTFTKPNPVTINTISQTGTTATATGFTYNFTNLLPGETRIIFVTMMVPLSPTVNINDQLTASAAISAPSGDINLANNTYSSTQIVVNSFDPNNKTESHGDKILHSSFTVDDYLYYTINFQNLGTANALTVRIEDTLDAKIEETSIRMVDASHNYTMSRVGNFVKWDFTNIMLTPASVNDAMSKGYVTFKVKLKPGFAVGDIIPNTGFIFFDTNPAIVTNTFNIKFVSQLANPNFSASDVVMYPNPANAEVVINLGSSGELLKTLSVTDISGKVVIQKNNLSDAEAVVNVSDLAAGVYLVEITTQNGFKLVQKLMVK